MAHCPCRRPQQDPQLVLCSTQGARGKCRKQNLQRPTTMAGALSCSTPAGIKLPSSCGHHLPRSCSSAQQADAAHAGPAAWLPLITLSNCSQPAASPGTAWRHWVTRGAARLHSPAPLLLGASRVQGSRPCLNPTTLAARGRPGCQAPPPCCWASSDAATHGTPALCAPEHCSASCCV